MRDSNGTHSIIRKEALNVGGAGSLSRQRECRPLVEHLAGELAIEILRVERGNTEIIGCRAAIAQCGSRAPEPIFGKRNRLRAPSFNACGKEMAKCGVRLVQETQGDPADKELRFDIGLT